MLNIKQAMLPLANLAAVPAGANIFVTGCTNPPSKLRSAPPRRPRPC
jgi:hypothetical protein